MLTSGDTVYSYYKPKSLTHALSAAEAGSGVVFIKLSNDETPTKHQITHAKVATQNDGTLRTLTNIYYDPAIGYVSVTGSSFAENDIVEVTGIKYAE